HLLYREALPSDPCRFGGTAVAPQMLKRRSVTSDRMLGAKNAVMDGVMPEAAPVALGMDDEGADACYDAEMEEEGSFFDTPAKVRSNFARAATWVPQKRLVDGKAVFSFTLPDTLTTWQLKAFAYTPDGRSGLLEKQIVAKQEVMLRPYLPRRLRVGDRITLNVAVSNTTQKTISTWVELNNGQRREVTLEPERSTTVSWEVAANFRPGTQAFAFTSPYDALRVELPVDDNRIAIEDVYPITLKHTEPYSLSVLTPTPEVALTERWNHRPNDLVIKALQHQLIFPYACSEQTFAKLNAMLLLKAYNAAPADADKQIAELQGKLLGMRQAGKLWPWFPGGDEDPYITAEICVGAARLKTLGHLPVELEAAVREVLEKQADRLPFPAWVYARTAWLEEWPLEDDLTDECLRERKFAGIQERLYLAIAAQRLGIETVAQGGLDSVLAAMTTSDIWGTQWPQERTWWNWYSTPIETHVLRAEVLRIAGRLEEAEGAALWLMQNVRMNDWGSTRATTAAVYCLLQSKIAKQSDKAPTVTCTKVAASDGVRSTLTYQKDTEGLSFGSVVANYSLRIEDVPPLELPPEYGVTIQRTYTPSNPKVGETIQVKLQIEAAQPLDRVWIQDHRPAHTEPMIQQPRWDWSTRAYLLPGDKGLDIFIGDLRRGTTVIEYELKATHAGTCTPGLATLQSMYAPDFATRTTAQPMTVTP
ncbi:MAG: alpha-2-macroglobulin family protein, partial [bacterium]|nr:alpha-2-macroglobulin family protein [bacterium]